MLDVTQLGFLEYMFEKIEQYAQQMLDYEMEKLKGNNEIYFISNSKKRKFSWGKFLKMLCVK